MRVKTPKLLSFSGRTAIHLAPPFLGGRSKISNTGVNPWLFSTRLHKFSGVSPQTTEINALAYVFGGKILRLFGKGLQRYISETTQDRHTVRLLIGSYTRSIERWHYRWPWVTPYPQNDLFLLHLDRLLRLWRGWS